MAHRSGFTYESMEDAATIRGYIEALLSGLESGRITLESGGRELALAPSGLLRFRIKAGEREGVGRISLRIEWRDPEAARDPEAGRAALSINTES